MATERDETSRSKNQDALDSRGGGDVVAKNAPPAEDKVKQEADSQEH